MKTIGASFSGGGFRAAAFTMGCLDYLNSVKLGDRTLLENIAFSSSTSGGSIAMAYHAMRSYEGIAFPTILKEARGIMEGDTLLIEAMRILEDKSEWTAYPTKNRNLINAFALAYDQVLYKGTTFGFLANKTHDPPIARYCFNSTELNHGLSFRFDHNGDTATIGDVGNGRQHFALGTATVANELRLSDIVASSSCFPIGFEPMVFPDDYEHAKPVGLGTALVNGSGDPLGPEELPFGVVDGGAVDNQGLRSLQIEASRRVERKLPPFDLLLICDVSGFYMDRYVVPSKAGSWRGWLNVGIVGLVIVLAGAAVPIGLGVALWSKAWMTAGVLALPAVLITMAYIALIGMLKGAFQGSWGGMMKRHALPLLLRFRLKTLRYLLVPRLRTLGLLLNNVFMNEIRRQLYRSLYEGKHTPLPIISCMVYELATKNSHTLERRMREKRATAAEAGHAELWDAAVAPLQLTAAMQKVADSAASMETTLWFDKANAQKLDELIACGRFTMCFNLLVYLAEVEAATGGLDKEKAQLRTDLLTHWHAYRKNPLGTE